MAPIRLPNRRSVRLHDFDYAQRGAYFVTMCATKHLCLFGEIQDGEMYFSDVGEIANAHWQDLPHHTPGLALDTWVVMPNHLHGIVVLPGSAASALGTLHPRGPKPGSLGAVIGGFKSAVSREVTVRQLTIVQPLWQRNYHERVIRNDRELDAIRKYIHDNPARWDNDPDHPRLDAPPRTTRHQ